MLAQSTKAYFRLARCGSNDLPDCLRQVSPRLFADDTNLTAAGETIEEVELATVNNDLLRIKEWLLANKLSLNVAKTEFLLIGSHHKLNNLDSKPSVNIGHDRPESVKQVRHSRVLGVEIDENLSWNKHIENVLKRLCLELELCEESVIFIYNALVRPHFDYCSEVWDTLGVGLSSRLQKLLNRAARIIMNLRYNTPGIKVINALGWESLETRPTKSKAKQMYKVLNDLAPSSLATLFVCKRNIDGCEEIWILCSSGKNNISRVSAANE